MKAICKNDDNFIQNLITLKNRVYEGNIRSWYRRTKYESQYMGFILDGQHPCIIAKAMYKMNISSGSMRICRIPKA